MRPEARLLSAAELKVGLTASFRKTVRPEEIQEFAHNSGDWNPLHVDPDYAAGTSYGRCIAHGAYQVGLASCLVGMHLPGKHALLCGTNARYLQPLFVPTEVIVRGEVTAWNAETRSGQLRVFVEGAADGARYSEIGMTFSLHEERATTASAAKTGTVTLSREAPVVLVTGASGGLGGAIAGELAANYAVVAMTRREWDGDSGAVVPLQTGLEQEGWEAELDAILDGRPLYGVVHCAWPGMPRGGLLQVAPEALDAQVRFGTEHLIRLARCLFDRAGEEGGRIVALGSVAGSRSPSLSAAAYSLGKAALEHTVRLLAPELARRSITINLVSPGFTAVGINRDADERRRKIEAAQVPLGRTCTPADVAEAVERFLSPRAGFVSGENYVLAGGRLN